MNSSIFAPKTMDDLINLTTEQSIIVSGVITGDDISGSQTNFTAEVGAANENALLVTRVLIQRICVPLMVLIGVLGNSLSILVLTRKCMKSSSTNSYLTALAMFDLLYLIFSFSLSLKHYGNVMTTTSYLHWFPFGRVFTDMTSNISVILTLTFTVERYIGVCHPMKGRTLCTPQRAKIITCAMSVIAILCTVPEFWELEVVTVREGNETLTETRYTEFANQPAYAVGYYWFLILVFTLLPLVLLCVFNGLLVVTLIQAAKIRKQLIRPGGGGGGGRGGGGGGGGGGGSGGGSASSNNSGSNKEQNRITKMLITVVLVFIFCQLPGALLLLYRTYLSLAEISLSREMRNEMKIAANVTNLLVCINASINFILYSAISTKFRRVFVRCFCRCYSMRPLTSHNSPFFSRTEAVQMSSFCDGDKIKTEATYGTSFRSKFRYSARVQRQSADCGSSHLLISSCPDSSNLSVSSAACPSHYSSSRGDGCYHNPNRYHSQGHHRHVNRNNLYS